MKSLSRIDELLCFRQNKNTTTRPFIPTHHFDCVSTMAEEELNDGRRISSRTYTIT